MNSNFTVSESLLYATVKIKSIVTGYYASSGTGFFVAFDAIDGKSAVGLVTNKHVLDGAEAIEIVCHVSDVNELPSGKFVAITIPVNNDTVIYHPDSKIDLCTINVSTIFLEAARQNKKIFFTDIGLGVIPKQDDWENFDALESVIMISCPNGIMDEVNNLPIIRTGNTASHLGKLYNGKQEFVVDMACFPGSSGSPIFVYNPSGYFDKKTGTNIIGTGRIYLIGILYAGPQFNQEGEVELAHSAKFNFQSMMHLGYAIRSTELHVLEQLVKQSRLTKQIGFLLPS